jgi:hypothetical protein
MKRFPSYSPYRTVIVEGFSADDLKSLRSQTPEHSPLSVFSLKEFDFMHFAPSLFYCIENSTLGPITGKPLLPTDGQHFRRQFEVEVASQFAVLENSVSDGYFTEKGFIDSKARAITRLVRMGWEQSEGINSVAALIPDTEDEWGMRNRRRGDVRNPVCDFDGYGYDRSTEERFSTDRERLQFMYKCKVALGDLLAGTPIVDNNRNFSRPQIKNSSHPMGAELQKFFGRDAGVVMYGSSTINEADCNDYDFMVLVNGLSPKHYQTLRGTIFGHAGKSVDVVLVDRSDWEDYLVKNPYSIGFLKDSIVVAGTVDFPKIDVDEAIMRGVSRAAGRLRTLHGLTLNWASLSPQELAGRPGLLSAMAKVPRYILSALLELRDLEAGLPHVSRGKAALEEILDSIGVKTSNFDSRKDEVVSFLHESMIGAQKVVDRFYEPRWVHLGNHPENIKRINENSKSLSDNFKPYDLLSAI